MQLNMLIQEIQQLSLQQRFFVMEQTLKSIKNEEFKNQKQAGFDELYDDYSNEKEAKVATYLVSEKSLAQDWLSDEDNRWDKVL